MIYSVFIIMFVRMNSKRYILCYCILNYDDNLIFDLNVSYMSFTIIFIPNFKSVISCHLCHIFSNQSKNYIKYIFQILIYTSIIKYKIRKIDFSRRTNLHFLFVGQLVRNNTFQCLSTVKANIKSSIIFNFF